METYTEWPPIRSADSAVNQVINAFKTALINKTLHPGDRLPSETELAASMQVSRGTIREAMKVLSAFGLVEIKRGNGTFICSDDKKISMDSVLFGFLLSQPSASEQIEFRTWLERIVMNLAIKNATDEDIRRLEENYSELLEVYTDSEKSALNELRFHELLGKITNNRLIARVYDFAIMYFRDSIESTHKNSGSSAALRVHRLTINAIAKRDYSLIEEIIAENISTWFQNSDSLYFGMN